LNASFKKQFHNATTRYFTPKINDHGIRRGDTEQILAQWWHTVASKVAMDMLHRVMRSSPYRLIRMAIKMVHNGGTIALFVRLILVK